MAEHDETPDTNEVDQPVVTDDGVMVHKKITTASLIPKDRLVVPSHGGTEWLYRIGGRATNTKRGTGTYGDWVALLGEFFATTFHDGQLHTSPKCHVPANIGELIASQLETDESGRTKAVDFVYDIGIVPNKREPKVKYDYVVRKPDGTDVRKSQVVAMMKGFPLPTGVVARGLLKSGSNDNQQSLPGM